MTADPGILIGKGEAPVYLLPRLANRHGLVAGATGTGKTVTLQVLAEGFSRHGVPVFLSDVKGDLAGISEPGGQSPKVLERVKALGLTDYAPAAVPVIFWDLFGEQGHPLRTTISEMGPLLLARLLELNDTQEGVLNVAFRVADEEGLLLLDLKDLRAMLNFVAENAASLRATFGNVSPASVGAIQRQLLILEQQGAEQFFGEPALDLRDLMRVDHRGQGYVSVLAADKLMQSPRLYSTFLLWLLSELFEELPEVGDLDRPKLVFFFDEAHLLFDGAPKALVDKVEQVVRLIRSKGVGVYFVSQSPLDVPEDVLGQLGNRVQHALRAFTPRDQKAVRAAAETFRANKTFDTATAITELGVGEALVSTLDAKGTPTVVERALVAPPAARLGPVTPEARQRTLQASPVRGAYDQSVDRESAYERLQAHAEAGRVDQAPVLPGGRAGRGGARGEEAAAQASAGGGLGDLLGGVLGGQGAGRPAPGRGRTREGVGEALAKSVVRSVGSSVGRELGRQILRGVLGSIFRGR
jgi:hypothetical protein